MKTSTCFRNKEGFPVVFAIKYGRVKWFNDISELFLFSVIKSIQEEQSQRTVQLSPLLSNSCKDEPKYRKTLFRVTWNKV